MAMTLDRTASQTNSFSTLEDDCGFKFQRKKRVSLAATIGSTAEQSQAFAKTGPRLQGNTKMVSSAPQALELIPEKESTSKPNKQKAPTVKHQQASDTLQQALINSRQLLDEKRRRRSSLGLKLGSTRRPSSIGLSLSQCTLPVLSSFAIN
jgi:hypothetical protein